MKLDLYSEQKYGAVVQDYQLLDPLHTASPATVIASAKEDAERFPIMILDDSGQLVGFFCLHIGQGPATYDFHGVEVALLRSFSIDNRFRRKGYATAALTDLFDFINQQISPEISQVVLAVNAENKVAQKVYEKAGFIRLLQTFPGQLGKLLIMEKIKAA